MKNPKVVTHNSFTVDLSSINAIKIAKNNSLVFIHKTRSEFVLNPITGEHELVQIKDISEWECYSFENAQALQEEWEGIWQYYLDNE